MSKHLLVLLVAAAAARAQDAKPVAPYGSTLTFGTGLVNIPVAWVSPTSGDLFAAVSFRAIGEGAYQPKANGSLWDLTESLEAHVGSRLTLGAALFGTKNQQVGAFGQLLVWRQPESGPRWLPSFAVGVRGLGASQYQDRFVTGDRRVVDVLPDSGHRAGLGKINGDPTVYGVLTREFQYESNSTSLTVGYGNGFFANSGNLDTVYNKRGTIAKGLFLGGRVVVPTGTTSQISFVVENDAWDWNAGAQVTWGHISIGLYLTELEEEKGVPDNKPLANFTKTALIFGYNASFPDIVRGSEQRAQATEAQLALRRIQQEIKQRRAHTEELVARLNTAAQGADAAAAAERARLLQQLDAEREALKKAAEQLDKLQKKPQEKS